MRGQALRVLHGRADPLIVANGRNEAVHATDRELLIRMDYLTFFFLHDSHVSLLLISVLR